VSPAPAFDPRITHTTGDAVFFPVRHHSPPPPACSSMEVTRSTSLHTDKTRVILASNGINCYGYVGSSVAFWLHLGVTVISAVCNVYLAKEK